MMKPKKNIMIKIVKTLIIFILIGMLSSCNKKRNIYDCTEQDYADCVRAINYVGDVTINVTINEDNNNVKFVIREGNFESGRPIITDTIDTISKVYSLDLDKYYSAAAYYKSGNDSIVVIDGGLLDYYIYKVCGIMCLEISHVTLDLRLK
jgi:hypothetical protein